jgi:nucleotide-binding universal stress UspA family protein
MTATPFSTSSQAPLLCGVDFSAHSRRALRLAARLAAELGRRLVVVTVVETLLAEAADVQFGAGQLVADATRDLEALVTATLAPGGPHPALSVRAVVGQPARTLLEVATADAAAAIVVGTQGLGWAGRVWFGSTTRRLLHAAALPVLAVPPADGGPTRGPAIEPIELGRVLCGIDFGAASTAAARVSLELGARLGLPVRLIHAVPRFPVPEPWLAVATRVTAERLDHARRHLETVAAALGLPAAAAETREGDPAAVLIDEAAAGPPALIVLGLESSPGHPHAGVTAYRVISAAHTPVLAIPGAGAPA